MTDRPDSSALFGDQPPEVHTEANKIADAAICEITNHCERLREAGADELTIDAAVVLAAAAVLADAIAWAVCDQPEPYQRAAEIAEGLLPTIERLALSQLTEILADDDSMEHPRTTRLN